MKRGKVYVQFPRTGLGNMLLVWSRAFVFSRLNGLPLVTTSWGRIQWGAWLRWERKKRAYWGYFREDGWWRRWSTAFEKKRLAVVTEPEVKPWPGTDETIFLFDQVSPEKDLFGPFRAHRDMVKEGILDLLSPRMRAALDTYAPPVIAIHIRRGDFKYGNPLTPTLFFIEAIRLTREAAGEQWPVTVFTDAAPGEIGDVLALPGVRLAEDKPDILDILLMSRSRVLVLSRSSTFSYWGAFLSDAIIIKPEGDWQDDLRPMEINHRIFEGKVDFDDPASVRRLEEGFKVLRN
ncbi:MAG TPA: hypothetical protein VGS79_04305 [Puia sp.]|nr:hypothetical protein [Puia sp.]